ncbi:BQ5605_C003g02030 [Microbotryum silenes-dioicae]|uniref:BQ5605_C003g02030 protein n=1 Tax=Microbotryum silenes-dioicae TaxID=796604 RepID=A0A2X0P349_9BASI|nr:BQ5605_C003g02030 [Microbotryum silenes-dioicae]
MRVAVVGCSHGSLDDIYASVERCNTESQVKGEAGIELLLCCGDFQAMRCPSDLHAMACPPKYRSLGDFSHYYSEQKRARCLTIVIGGNHESSGYMWECFHGGWLAPDIYFLGFAGCILVDGWLRIAGASGIWKAPDFKKGHFETVPFDDSTIRSVYHIREYEVARLTQLETQGPQVDIFLSHDWPLGIERFGNTAALIRQKPFFKDEIASNSLGSPPLKHLLSRLRPSYWFSAHLHVKFAAWVDHLAALSPLSPQSPTLTSNSAPQTLPPATQSNPDEITMDDNDDDDDDDEAGHSSDAQTGRVSGVEGELASSAVLSPEQLHGESRVVGNLDQMVMEDDEGAKPAGHHDPIDGEDVNHPLDCSLEIEDGGSAVHSGKDVKIVSSEEASETAEPAGASARTTRFLALSKPGARTGFLQVVDIAEPHTSHMASKDRKEFTHTSCATSATENGLNADRKQPQLQFDPHWLSIVKAFAPFLSIHRRGTPLPPPARLDELVAQAHAWITENVPNQGCIEIAQVQQFSRTAPGFGEPGWDSPIPTWYTNPQTEALCALLGIENRINPPPPARPSVPLRTPPSHPSTPVRF